MLSVVEQIADTDPNKKVQAKAVEILAKLNDKKYQPLFTKYAGDSSYSVSGAALDGLVKLVPSEAYTLAKKYASNPKGKLGSVVTKVIMENGTEDDFNIILENYKNSPASQTKIEETFAFANYLSNVKNGANVKKGVDEIMKLRNQIPEKFRSFVDPAFKQVFSKISTTKRSEGNTELADYINNLLK